MNHQRMNRWGVIIVTVLFTTIISPTVSANLENQKKSVEQGGIKTNNNLAVSNRNMISDRDDGLGGVIRAKVICEAQWTDLKNGSRANPNRNNKSVFFDVPSLYSGCRITCSALGTVAPLRFNVYEAGIVTVATFSETNKYLKEEGWKQVGTIGLGADKPTRLFLIFEKYFDKGGHELRASELYGPPRLIFVPDNAATASAPVKSRLSTKWESGEVLRYSIEDEGDTSFGEGDRLYALQTSLKLDTTWRVESVLPDGSVTMSVAIDRLQYATDGQGLAAKAKGYRFDSNTKAMTKKPHYNLLNSLLQSYVGPVASISIDGRGRVTEFSADQDLSARLDQNDARELSGFFGGLFNTNGIRNLLTDWLVEYPSGELSSGSIWKQEEPSWAGGGLLDMRTYKIAGTIEKNGDTVLHITFTPQLYRDDKSKQKIISQNGDGVVYLDPDSNKTKEFVLRHEYTISWHGNITHSRNYSSTLQ